MGEGRKQLLKGSNTPPYNHEQAKDKDYRWVIMEGHDNDDDNDNNNYGGSSASNSLEDSVVSLGSISSSDMVDDASSTSNSCSSSSHSSVSGPLYELSELMAQLPIKRSGLSKYFEGKSQSFTSLSSVMRIEDLAKKETPCRRKIKACKSYGGGLDNHKQYTLPKATISKKASRGSLSSSSFSGRRGSFLGISRPPPIPAQKINF
ncbi:hypothetical protein F2P56_016434 [Juglans regia]|uniref:Uncharacterized protein LOC108981955 n=2 Tax=Juglans regia TaxID=51240 RepID=A0A2I4DNP1_JUGRE|nr:uncharacterized protein LOC108981955 [Juglans regia]KAF5466516.1 hypothetical protein F2P56_016434 [Juglans regia]